MADWENLKTRARRIWCYPWTVASVLSLSALGIIFIITLASFFEHVSAARSDYEARIRGINSGLYPVTSAQFRGDKQTLVRLSRRCLELIDSLDFGAQVRGYVVGADLRPPDFLGTDQPFARIDVLLDCGCVETGVYDILSFDIDPITLHATVTRVARSLALTRYTPLPLTERR